MITIGLALVLVSGVAGGLGALGYLASRRSQSRSRSAALVVFGHGAVGTSALFFLATIVHLHSLLSVHLHPLSEAFQEAFLCDLEWSCAAGIAAVLAATVLAMSFVLSQVLSRAIVARALRSGARRLAIAGQEGVFLLRVPDPTPDAFSVSILRLGGRWMFRVEDFVVITSGLARLLTPEERRVVLEHELAHVRSRDSRYLPWFHVLASVVFFDPMLRALRRRIGRQYEFEADAEASHRTRAPRALAQALLKMYEAAVPAQGNVSFLGGGEAQILVERIERLLALAERMERVEALPA